MWRLRVGGRSSAHGVFWGAMALLAMRGTWDDGGMEGRASIGLPTGETREMNVILVVVSCCCTEVELSLVQATSLAPLPPKTMGPAVPLRLSFSLEKDNQRAKEGSSGGPYPSR